MGLTFDELETFGKLRKVHRLGPFGMFRRLLSVWNHLSPTVIAAQVKKFFRYYAMNRHKVITLTAAFHAEVNQNKNISLIRLMIIDMTLDNSYTTGVGHFNSKEWTNYSKKG